MIIAQPRALIAAFVNVMQGQPASAPWGEYTALGLKKDGRLVAGVIYTDFAGANVYAHIGAEEGRRWMTKEFLFAMFDYPFNQLKLRRVTALVKEKNKRARLFVEKLGFVREGRMRSYFMECDALIYGMTREECRFLSEVRKAA